MNQKGMMLPKFNEILNHHRGDPEALIVVLQKTQRSLVISPQKLFLPLPKPWGFSQSGPGSGYLLFPILYSPRGRNVVKVCRGTACHVRGGRGVLRVVQKTLNLQDGETATDYSFTLETVACLGACALSPVMVVNQTYFGKMNPKRIETILQKYK